MPAALRMAFLRTRQRAAGYDFVSDPAGTLRSTAGGPGGTAAVAATPRGVRLSRAGDGGFELGVETTGVGRDGTARSRAVIAQHAEGQELVLEREDDVEERYLAGPLGLEQSFLLRARPGGQGPVGIEVTFAGLGAEVAGGATDRVLLRDAAGRVRAGYRGLVAVDAEGQELPARMEVRAGGVVALVVDDAGAAYPLRVDPMVWTEQAELTAADGADGDELGYSVAMSGGTAIVGASNHKVGSHADQGAAYVFVRSGTTWSQQAELTASDGQTDDAFGYSVALSGSVAIVSTMGHQIGNGGEQYQGAAYVFVQSGATWSQQAELRASHETADDEFGASVALSGTTALIGAPAHRVGSVSRGAAFVFVQSGTAWSEQAELTASDGAGGDEFGYAVALSGSTALVGAYSHNSEGSAYVFARSGTTWSLTAELTPTFGGAQQDFGTAVALSGSVALVGASAFLAGDFDQQGAAYVFVQSGTAWTQQAVLSASDGAAGDGFGASVALSGGTALVGADSHQAGADVEAGAAYVFVQSGTTWSQQAELMTSDGGQFDRLGTSVALSDGAALVGAVGHQVGSHVEQGAAYVFIAPPFCATAADGTPCDAGDACTQTATCQAGTCTAQTFAPAGTVCRAPAGPCDDGATCTGSAAACPADALKPDGTPCAEGTCQAGTCASGGAGRGAGTDLVYGRATCSLSGEHDASRFGLAWGAILAVAIAGRRGRRCPRRW